MHINILGYGLMAKQIAALFYIGGYKVSIWNHKKVEPTEVERQIRLLKRSFTATIDGEISFVDALEDLGDHLTIESVIEDIDVKRGLYNKLNGTITKGYYTNTSSYSPDEIGSDVKGLHFFNPIVLKFIELYETGSAHNKIDNELLYLKSLGFEVVSVKNNRGYIGNFILFHEISSALKLVEKYNYTVESINLFYNKLYDGRDIFAIVDIIGIDVVYCIIVNMKEQDDSLYLPKCLTTAIQNNILGKKNKTSIKQILP